MILIKQHGSIRGEDERDADPRSCSMQSYTDKIEIKLNRTCCTNAFVVGANITAYRKRLHVDITHSNCRLHNKIK